MTIEPRDGLWIALLLDGTGRARSLDLSAAATWTVEQGPLWIHLDPSSPQPVEWMRTSSGLSAAQVHAFLATDPQPRFKEVGEDRLVASLSGFSPELEIGLSRQALLQMWIEPERMLTLCPIVLPGVARLEAAFQRGEGPRNIPELMVAMAEQLTGQLRQHAVALELPMADLEFAAQAEQRSPLGELQAIETRIARLRRNLAPTLIVLDRIHSLADAVAIHPQIKDWRALLDEARQTEAVLKGVHDRAHTLHSYINARQAERMNYILYVLTILSAIMLPLTFFTGLFGMNVGIRGGSYQWMEHTLAFVLIAVGLVALTLLEYRVIRRRHLLMVGGVSAKDRVAVTRATALPSRDRIRPE